MTAFNISPQIIITCNLVIFYAIIFNGGTDGHR